MVRGDDEEAGGGEAEDAGGHSEDAETISLSVFVAPALFGNTCSVESE